MCRRNRQRLQLAFHPPTWGCFLTPARLLGSLVFLTFHEFAEQPPRRLRRVEKLPRSRGHLFNWYDTRTLEPLRPSFISSVDSGNLVASLWTLQQGCLDLLRRPLLERRLAEG